MDGHCPDPAGRVAPVAWVLITCHGGEWATDIDGALYETVEQGRAALADALDIGYRAVLAEVVPVTP